MASESKCHKLWRSAVFMTANYTCEWPGCGKENHPGDHNWQLHPHHFFSRGIKSTRFWVPNGVCLCAWHHKLSPESAHESPFGLAPMIIPSRHDGWLEELIERKNLIVKYNAAYLEWCEAYLNVYLSQLAERKGASHLTNVI
jgi:hypothetical protein